MEAEVWVYISVQHVFVCTHLQSGMTHGSESLNQQVGARVNGPVSKSDLNLT